MSPKKIIEIEEQEGPFKMVFQRVMRMVPDKDRNDKKLQRLIAFRLKQDGEGDTCEYLVTKIREVIQCAYTGRLYDYLKNDLKRKECFSQKTDPTPPDVA